MDTPALFPEVLAQLDPQRIRLPEARPNDYFRLQGYRLDEYSPGQGDAVRLYLAARGLCPARYEPDPDFAEMDARVERSQVGNARAVLQKLMFELDPGDVIALGRLAALFANQPADAPALIASAEAQARECAVYAQAVAEAERIINGGGDE